MTGQSLYGELNGGTVIELSSLRYARALLDGSGAAVLRSLGERLPFEIACGLNGRVWVKASSVVNTIVVSNAVLNAVGAILFLL